MTVAEDFFPVINSESSVASKKQTRGTWDRDFVMNYSRFAATVADRIAHLYLTELKQALESGYKATPTQMKPLTRDFSLEMTQKGDAQLISEWAGEDLNLPPLKSGLTLFQ